MNVIESCTMTSPNYRTEECAQLTIDDTAQAYVLPDVMVVGREYTFSCWLMAETASLISVGNVSIAVTTEWTYHICTFVASAPDLVLSFAEVGTYYIYHPQLELGNKATDWTAAPEDVELSIVAADEMATNAKNLADDTEKRVSSTEISVVKLTERVESLEPISRYVDINLDGTKPYTMELGEQSSVFRLRLSNTDICFMDGSFVAAYISNKRLHIDTAVIESELQIGSFVWTKRANGNTGLIWKNGGI